MILSLTLNWPFLLPNTKSPLHGIRGLYAIIMGIPSEWKINLNTMLGTGYTSVTGGRTTCCCSRRACTRCV